MIRPDQTDAPWILPIDSDRADLACAGGKGASLSRMARGGLPVPGGFIVTTQAYREFLAANDLERQILAHVPTVAAAGPDAFERASVQIRALFAGARFPESLAGALREAYARLGEGAVAVRSSATTEDLPELSFAGQQDTFLNVVGADNLIPAVLNCWSSLWTARAIGYRSRNRVPQSGIALAVVVQIMVESEASGVLFTSNPLTGLRAEMVIDATFGLGEALVSGQVEPDHYVASPFEERVPSARLGSKRVIVRGRAGGGTQAAQEDRGTEQALPDEQILALARLGQQAAGLFGSPQDIEWAWARGSLSLLQSRPITSLFPLPQGMPADPLQTLFSFGAVQGLLDPVTPLGRDMIRLIMVAGGRLFGARLSLESQHVLYEAGERLWVNITPLLRNSVGRRVVRGALGFVEPTIRQAIDQIWDEPSLEPKRPGVSLRARVQILRAALPLVANIVLNLVAPRSRRAHIVRRGERMLQEMEARLAALRGSPRQRLLEQVGLQRALTGERLPSTLILFVSAVAAGMASWNLLNLLVSRRAKPGTAQTEAPRRDSVLQVTRGMPHNPTTEMDLTLWETAQAIRRDPSSLQAFRADDASQLAARFLRGDLPEGARQVVGRFLQKYGARGPGEIDLGRTRWAEDPAHVFEMIASFLQIADETLTPDVVFARSADSAHEAIERLVASVRRDRLGWLKAGAVRYLSGRARQWMGARESPKFFMVRMMWLQRRALLSAGQDLVQAGDLDRPDDLMYLTLSELRAFAAGGKSDWRSLVAGRREAYRRESLRRQVPRLLLSDGRAFYEGMREPAGAGEAIVGSPVSPGSAEGLVRVVLDPREAHLAPGEILVCPGTDPSWTPLFLSAAGLVMETGGMMTHGAVVAREYGIPAIVGVDRATLRLQTGQRIRLDGSTGRIILMEPQ